MDTPEDPGTVTFEQHRRLLLAMGYRMLGSRAEAEELVQDTWLRWRTADTRALRSPRAWLITAATRLAIDRLRHARRERLHYEGPGCPNPGRRKPRPTRPTRPPSCWTTSRWR